MRTMVRDRLAAYALDSAGYAAIAGCTVPLGLAARRAGWGKSQTSLMWLSTIPVALATAVATVAESRGATWGKQSRGLTVTGLDADRLSVNQALVRNVVKIAIPWQLGHVVTVRGAFGDFEHPDAGLVATTAATYGLVAIGLIGVLSRPGVTLHDLLSRSRVVRTEPEDAEADRWR